MDLCDDLVTAIFQSHSDVVASVLYCCIFSWINWCAVAK